ncbi:hypothetical protein LMG32289_05567 [Cupriavidus pampae]|uniref:Mycothiol-dependent maleylpyruvate isomerase metal-binding domain-containing protein n=2 Tax=Cupriavidus pampae TaxID=659251 RepID=A0ABM8XV29_9BURK|nr:hypothetical protein LMG32289_05567 [Cupriavidus pampae]
MLPGPRVIPVNYCERTNPEKMIAPRPTNPPAVPAPQQMLQPAPTQRFTPEQWKAFVKWKGWTYKELAAHWGISTTWMSNLARNPARAAHWNDALVGLPNKRTMTRDKRLLARRLHGLLDEHSQEARSREAARAAAAEAAKRSGAGYRHHGYFAQGTIVTACRDIGMVASEGDRGIVFQVEDLGKGERYGIVFETTLWDWFLPEHLDHYLATTGLTDPVAAATPFVDERGLQQLVASHKLVFWPAIPSET